MKNPLKILVTGAFGFIGANLCRKLADLGNQVYAAERPQGNGWRLADRKDIARVTIDLCDRKSTSETLGAIQPQVIFHCAAYGAYSSQSDADRIYRVNLESTRNLLEEVRKLPEFRAFVQAGSSSEYGLNCAGPEESSGTIPDSHYAVSKTAATGLVQYYGKRLAVPAWSMRLYSVYGPWEDGSRLIPSLILATREGRLPPLVSPDISRDFIHVDDVVESFVTLIAQAPALPKGEIFNIGTGRCTKLSDLVDIASRQFGVKVLPEWGSMPNRA